MTDTNTTTNSPTNKRVRTAKPKAIKRGRPPRVDWSKFTLLWKSHTDSEIAHKANCTVVNVFLRRKRLISAAADDKKAFYSCSKPAYTKSRFLKEKAN